MLLYPVWWASGLTTFIYPLLAIPMAVQLHRRPVVRVPPGFGVWVLLIVVVVLASGALGEAAPGTLATDGSGKYLAAAVRIVQYLSFTVIMLYVLSLDEQVLPRLRVIRLLGVMCLVTVIGGYAGMLFPDLSFTAPLRHLLPGPIASDPFVARLMQIEVAQVQDVLDDLGQPRPSAPFEFTNSWGENLCLLLVWLFVGCVVLGRGKLRIAAIALMAAAIVPVVYSLNRGLWIGIGIVVVYVSLRLAIRGRFTALGGVAAAVALSAVLVVATPLGSVFEERLDNGHSDDIRTTLSVAAVETAASSPLIGYGGNRPLLGSGRSIAIGKSVECPQCGNREIGSNGMAWHLMISTGFVGVGLYNLFFLWNLWRFRRDDSAIGIAGSAVLILMLFFQTAYGAYDSAMAYALISVALLARNDLQQSDRLLPVMRPIASRDPAVVRKEVLP
jgi:hypothetical protein